MTEALTILSDLADRMLDDSEDLAAAARLAAAATSGDGAGVGALLGLARLIGEASDSGALSTALRGVAPESPMTLLVIFVAECFAAAHADYPTRQDATAVRSRMAGAADALYPLLAPAGPDAVDFVARIAGRLVQGLSAQAANRAPLVRVELNLSLPSALLAWQLYADPARAGELVARNHVGTAMLMPATFEAVAT
jgi:hypothetical protein